MQFLFALYYSLWDLPWLKNARLAPQKAWGYFLVLMTVFTALFFIPVAFSLPQSVRDFQTVVAKDLPSFQAVWTNGSLVVSGVQQPYVSKGEGYVLVVDTVSTTTIDLQKYLETKQQKVLLITKNKMAALDGATGEQQSQDWDTDFSWSVNKEQVVAWLAAHTSFGNLIVISLILLVIIFVSVVLSKLWLLAVVTSIVLLLSMLMRRGWRWGELFVIGLYGMTLPCLISYLIGLTGLRLSGLYFSALLAFMVAVAFTNDKPEAAIDFSDESDSL